MYSNFVSSVLIVTKIYTRDKRLQYCHKHRLAKMAFTLNWHPSADIKKWTCVIVNHKAQVSNSAWIEFCKPKKCLDQYCQVVTSSYSKVTFVISSK